MFTIFCGILLDLMSTVCEEPKLIRLYSLTSQHYRVQYGDNIFYKKAEHVNQDREIVKYWYCGEKGCKANLHTDNDCTYVIKANDDHNHDKISLDKENRKKAIIEMSLSEKTPKDAFIEYSVQNPELACKYFASYESVRRQLNRAKQSKKNFSEPRTLEGIYLCAFYPFVL